MDESQRADPPAAQEVAGIGRELAASVEPVWPVHGLRHRPGRNTSGWYLWTGDLTDDPDFFVPMHPIHLADRYPRVLALLDREPGTRFILAQGYLDIWSDESLLASDG